MDKSTYDQVLHITNKIDELKFSRYDKLIQFTRHIITLSIGLLTVLIAFRPDNHHHHHILFVAVLLCIGLSCLSGLVFLHHVIDEHNQTLKFYKEKRADILNGDLTGIEPFFVKKKAFYEISKYVFYWISIVALVLLIVYGSLN